MCGRFVSTTSPEEIAERFQVDESRVGEHAPDYNVSPRRSIYAIRDRAGGDDERTRRHLDLLRWGLVPSWAEDPRIGDKMINARAESIASKPGFRRAFEKRRCIIPADGFYEWQALEGRRKQPMYIHRSNGELLAFAGLWEAWRDPDRSASEDPWLRSCVIVTTDANELLAPIHDRMPVVLAESDWARWLDPENHEIVALEDMLRPAPAEWFEVHPVSTRVNHPSHNDPDLLAPAEA